MSGISDPWEAAADRWWDAARKRERDFLLGTGGLGCRPGPAEAEDRLWRLTSPQWIPGRRPPRLPSRWEIASYWAGLGLDDWFGIDMGNPHCFACGLHGAIGGSFPEDMADLERRWNSARRLEKGHIVNRARDGLDRVQNLALLCRFCNKNMPMFGVEDQDAAVAWITSGGAVEELMARLASRGRTVATA